MSSDTSYTQDLVSSMFQDQSASTRVFLDILFIIILLIGALKVLVFVWITIAGSWKHCFRGICQRKDRLYRKYGVTMAGVRSWIVVTGGSDGVGLDIAKQAAVNQGFNICIISRNEEKMKQKLKELPEGIETMYIVADFTKMASIKDYKEIIGDKLSKIDIGLLVLNAGWAEFGPFEWLTDQIVEDHIRINLLHVIYTSKVLATQMIQRYELTKKKAGIIVISSGLGLQPVGGCVTYAASKTFVSYFAQGLAVEFQGKIDVMSYHAGIIKTKFIDDMDENMKNNRMMVIRADTAAQVALRDIGCDVTTGGALKHSIDVMRPPPGVFANIMFKAGMETYQKKYPDDDRFKNQMK